MNRGIVTSSVNEKAKKFLGREITVTELRLYPYIDYCLKNGGFYDRKKIDHTENQILIKLENEKHIDRCGNMFFISKEFYDFMNDVLWDSYVETKLSKEGEEDE